MTAGRGIEPRTHSWKASAITRTPTLLPQRKTAKAQSSLWSQLRGVYFFLNSFCTLLQCAGNGSRSLFSNLKDTDYSVHVCVGELWAVFAESKISTLTVYIFRILNFSTANTTARCHTSKTRILTPCNFFPGFFYYNRRTLSIFIQCMT